MPVAALAPSLIGAGASIVGSLLSGKPKTQTQTTTPTLTPQMQQTMDGLLAYGSNAMQNGGGSAVTTMKNNSIDQVNRNYMGVPARLSSQFASRGYGNSGSFGSSLYNTEYQRQGDLSGLQSQFAKMGLDQQNFGAGLNEQLLNFGKGSTTAGTTPDTSAQNGFLSAGNGLSNLSTLMMLSNVLKGGGGGGYTPGNMNTSGGSEANN
jgi:hypothetical protein